MDEANIKIPFFQLVQRLLLAIVPCMIGMLISTFLPKTKAYVLRFAKPVALSTVISFLFLTLVTKFYTYALIEWKQWIFAPCLSVGGFVIGLVASFVFRLPVKQVYTIGIETGLLKNPLNSWNWTRRFLSN
jgi:hypothetical protein